MTSEYSDAATGSLTSEAARAAEWARTWYVATHPTLVRVLTLLPLLTFVGLLNAPSSVRGVLVAGSAVGWLLAFLAFYYQSLRTVAPLIEALTPVAAFADTTVARAVLNEATELQSVARLHVPDAQRIVRDAAQRLFRKIDDEGCGQGHADLCRHRRNATEWDRWLTEPAHQEDHRKP